LATGLWTEATMQQSFDLLRRVLGPAGNPARERIFRMNVTLCLHRAISDEELEQLPDWFHAAQPTDLAGGPIEILYETEDSGPSTKPCASPVRIPLDRTNPLLWFPGDCGACESCRARAVHDRRLDEAGRTPLYMDELLAQAREGREL
jgi:hypothetical protein